MVVVADILSVTKMFSEPVPPGTTSLFFQLSVKNVGGTFGQIYVYVHDNDSGQSVPVVPVGVYLNPGQQVNDYNMFIQAPMPNHDWHLRIQAAGTGYPSPDDWQDVTVVVTPQIPNKWLPTLVVVSFIGLLYLKLRGK